MPNLVSVPGGDVGGYGDLPSGGAPPPKIAKMTEPKYGGSTFIGPGTSLSPEVSAQRICERTELLLGKSNINLVGALSPTTE